MTVGVGRGTGPRALLKLLAACITAVTIGLFVLLALADRRIVEREAISDLTAVVQLLGEHTRAALRANSIQLNRVADLIGDRPLAALRGSVADWRRLRGMLDDQPDGDSFWIFDATGELVLSTEAPSGITRSARGRDLHAALRQRPGEVFVSPLIWGERRGGYFFASSRAVLDGNGAVRGLVQSWIDARHFAEFYRRIRPDSDAAFVIVKADGAVVVRWPLPADGVGGSRADVTFPAQSLRTASGHRAFVSPIDGVRRLYAYQRIDGTDLFAVAGLPTAEVFHDWAMRTRRNGVFAAGLLGTFLLMTGLALRSARNLESALADKDTLFQEIHHRVKNNLQIVSSLLTMQAVNSPDAATRAILDEALSRIHAMGLVHHTLYQQNEAAQVDMASYLHALVQRLELTYGGRGRGITTHLSADAVLLDLERAVPLALLVNEALTNVFKHAFPDGRPGRVDLRFWHQEGGCVLTIHDDGIGLPAVPRRGSLGLHLMRSLANQLQGRLAIEGHPEAGTIVRLDIPL